MAGSFLMLSSEYLPMKIKYAFAIVLLLAIGLAAVLTALSNGIDFEVLNPKGLVALKEKQLIFVAVVLMLLVVVPVYALAFMIAWRYRAGNADAVYTPDQDHNLLDEFIWWAIPLAIIFTLAIITWKTTHELDPFKPLDSAQGKPLTIQVVALDWKWLFIYPEQGIATVNFVEFPERTPIDFEITADAPMNSFWIPSLGGQTYAMPGMSTQLHLIADGVDSYRGMSANFSGAGFSGMKFTAQSVSKTDFDQWVESVQQIPTALDNDSYRTLAVPSANAPVVYYGSADPGLYNTVVLKHLSPHVSMPALRHN